jgi:CBS domain-containing protein
MDNVRDAAEKTMVRSIMQTDVVTVHPSTTVRDLVRLLAERRIGGTPVVDGSGALVGIVSTSDLVRLAAGAAEPALSDVLATLLPGAPDAGAEGLVSFLAMDGWGDAESLAPVADAEGGGQSPVYEEYLVRDVMRRAPFSVAPESNLRELAVLFLRERIHRAPVVEGGRLVGIVTTFDVLRAVADGS